MSIEKTIHRYLQLIRFDRPVGSFLLLWPTLTALVIASHGYPTAANVLIFTLGVFLMRSAGCILNDFVDRDIDHQVTRTQLRPLTQRTISTRGALTLCTVLLLAAFLLVLQTNLHTILLAFVALTLTACYPFMKRILQAPQIWLGLTFNFGILMAYTAAGKMPDFNCFLLYLATLILTVAYDTFYAMADRADDLKIGVKSTAILFGSRDRVYTALLQVAYLALMIWLGARLTLNIYFTLGLGLALACIIYQQYLIRERKPDDCLHAFLNNHYLLLFIFLGVYLSYFRK